MEFKSKYNHWVEKINGALEQYVPEKASPEGSIYSAMRYSLMAGGKRLRPVLALAVCEMLEGDLDEVMPFGCAIEAIHTYSLIHDDLPAMDNDDYRRGRLTNHKVYGEAKAILAGDALLNFAFELMLGETLRSGRNLPSKVEAMHCIAKAAGAAGMIGGQVVDLESEGREIPADLLEYMHRCKTGALIKAPIAAAAVLCGAKGPEQEDLERFAEKIGLAFQVKDDILDVEGDLAVMGKKAGSDAAKQKSTFVSLYGLQEAKGMLDDLVFQAEGCMERFGKGAWFLRSLARYIAKREN